MGIDCAWKSACRLFLKCGIGDLPGYGAYLEIRRKLLAGMAERLEENKMIEENI
ncbi:MAG TPA: hypothetical protein PLO51_00025 [Candidatus Micrarchaeota archaeon]|nr:hypothetical protein [Candidatus Micrarchaeota archaeon]